MVLAWVLGLGLILEGVAHVRIDLLLLWLLLELAWELGVVGPLRQGVTTRRV